MVIYPTLKGGVEADDQDWTYGPLIPKSSLGIDDFALRSDEPTGYQTLTSLLDRHEVTKTLILKVLSGADDEYQHGDLKRRSINLLRVLMKISASQYLS